jgi:hypothetical protein
VLPLVTLVSTLTLALIAPSGWTTLQDGANTQFFFPRQDDRSTFVAIFPQQKMSGTLQRTLTTLWHRTIGAERVVDAEEKSIPSADGAPALLEIIATVDGANRGVYRIFMVKQYGDRIVSGEFRSDDPDKMKGIGDAALQMLRTMSVTPADETKAAQ